VHPRALRLFFSPPAHTRLSYGANVRFAELDVAGEGALDIGIDVRAMPSNGYLGCL